MTCREKIQIEKPELVDKTRWGGVIGCPHHYDLAPIYEGCAGVYDPCSSCVECWNREYEEE